MLSILKKNKEVESIVQFGSSLKSKRYRDIDICVFTSRKFTLKEKLALYRDLPEKYDISFYDDLPMNLRKAVTSEGKILFTKDYYIFLKELQYVDLEYPKYAAFLKQYTKNRLAEI